MRRGSSPNHRQPWPPTLSVTAPTGEKTLFTYTHTGFTGDQDIRNFLPTGTRSAPEIAEVLGCSSASVRQSHRRALTFLAERVAVATGCVAADLLGDP